MPETEAFTSKTILTSNVAKELLKVAKAYGLSVHDLDFTINKTELFIKEAAAETKEPKKEEKKENSKEGSATSDFKVIDDQMMAKLKDPEAQANPNIVLKQVYDVEIFPLVDLLFPKLEMTIAANKSVTSVYATIKAGSVIDSVEDISRELKHYFNKRKLRTQLLIDIWDEEMVSEVTRLAAQIEVNGSVSFEEDLKILISKSLLAKDKQDDALTIHFDQKEEEGEFAKVDYKQRGFIKGVEQNELLITYLKPLEGTPGRNCKGEFIEVLPPDATHVPTFEIDPESIEIKEDETKQEYFARKNGYIDIESNKYYIKEALEVNEISFKSTGNVNAGINTNISIHVQESDPLGDAIGMGVEVEATDVDVEGNVGSNSKVEAQKIRIGGQTHKSSILIADNVEVNLHRGLIQGKDVKVKRLEQGRIEGETVEVEQAAGGEIVAKNVVIEILQSHMSITASESITIKKMLGSENTLEIDQTKVGKNANAVDDLEDELDVKRQEINVSRKKIDEKKALFAKHKDAMHNIKKRLVGYKKAGVKLPEAFVKKYKEFQALQMHIGTLEIEHKLMVDMFEMMEKRKGRFQRSVVDAQVINQDSWKGHNEIRFHLTAPEQTLTYVPKEGLHQSAIMLKYDEEKDEYTVVSESADIPGL
jgi:hypothetical protein